VWQRSGIKTREINPEERDGLRFKDSDSFRCRLDAEYNDQTLKSDQVGQSIYRGAWESLYQNYLIIEKKSLANLQDFKDHELILWNKKTNRGHVALVSSMKNDKNAHPFIMERDERMDKKFKISN